VQVALQPPALGVAGLDDARARGGELLARVGVGERLRDELGEVAPRARRRSSRGRPRICSAAALQSVMTPPASRTTSPSAIESHDRAQPLLVGAQRVVGARRARR
jgi:hypothetical protein